MYTHIRMQTYRWKIKQHCTEYQSTCTVLSDFQHALCCIFFWIHQTTWVEIDLLYGQCYLHQGAKKITLIIKGTAHNTSKRATGGLAHRRRLESHLEDKAENEIVECSQLKKSNTVTYKTGISKLFIHLRTIAYSDVAGDCDNLELQLLLLRNDMKFIVWALGVAITYRQIS